jgi:hypothetical protein
VVAIIDWSSSALLKENVRFFQAAESSGKIRPREWRESLVKFRSLTLWADGSGELQHFSTAAVARRLGWSVVKRTARKVRMSQGG